MGKNEQQCSDCITPHTRKFYEMCAAGGALACGSSYLLFSPLDTAKVRLQVKPYKYRSILNSFNISRQEGGILNLIAGWSPAFIGYSIHGAAIFSGYEYFKRKYHCMTADEETAYLYRTHISMAAAATAEAIACIGLAPFETVKLRMQTGCFASMRDAFRRLYQDEGPFVFYRSLVPLWSRQIPYTMMKFAAFERSVEYLYDNWMRKKQEQCTQYEQLMVTFTAGSMAGVLCALVSHHTDIFVSWMNKGPGMSISSVRNQLDIKDMWQGFLPRILIISVLTGLQWFIYDSFRMYTCMPRPPPPEMPPKKGYFF